MNWSEPHPWAIAVTCCAALAVWGHHRNSAVLHRLFKPLTTIVIAYVAWLMVPPGPQRPWVLNALLFSLIGDVVLMWEGDRPFMGGLVSFLIALVCWSVAMSVGLPFTWSQLIYLVLPGAVGMLILSGLWPGLGKLRWPVAVYGGILVIMAWRALSRFHAPEIPLLDWLWGSLGAAAFITGDTLLARRRFVASKAPYALELGVYYLAQWLLVVSMC